MRRSLTIGLVTVAVLLGTGISMADSTKYPVSGLVKSGSASGTGTTPVTVISAADAPSTAAGVARCWCCRRPASRSARAR